MDLISRQAAIDAVVEITYDQTALHHGWVDPYYVVNRLEYLPTAEPRMGKWEIDVDCKYDVFDIAGERTWAVKAKCSECGFTMRYIEGHGVFKYCPNCGARMEENE